MIYQKGYSQLPINEEEILRYLSYRGKPTATVFSVLDEVKEECVRASRLGVCYAVGELSASGKTVRFDTLQMESEALSHAVNGCSKGVLFCATLGVGVDRLLIKYAQTNPLKGAVLQAIGAAYVEALCDEFCRKIAAEKGLFSRPRFSPGYGDFSLENQKQIFAYLCPENKIGVALNDSILMSPSKSVTAILPLSDEEFCGNSGCTLCENTACTMRK